MGLRPPLPLQRTTRPHPPQLHPLVQQPTTAQLAWRPATHQPRLTPLWSGQLDEEVERGRRLLERRDDVDPGRLLARLREQLPRELEADLDRARPGVPKPLLHALGD